MWLLMNSNELIIINRLDVLADLTSETSLDSEHWHSEQNQIIQTLAETITDVCEQLTASPSSEFWKKVATKTTLIEAHIKDYGSSLEIEALESIRRVETELFEKNLTDWCNEKQGSEEYDYRLAAAKKIRECYSSGGTTLDLSGCGLTSLPDSFGNLRSLTTLDLGSNKLTSLPDSFGNLQSLTTLDLRRNKLTSLPDSFGNLRSLTTLNLSGNKLTSLPDSFGNLQSLTTLDLRGNELTSLPDFFGNLQSLTTLHLNGNKLYLRGHNDIEALSILLNSSTNQVVSLALANYVLGNLERLNIEAEHPLTQTAIEIRTLFDPAIANSPQNPFNLFSQLKKSWNENPPEQFPLVQSNIAGTTVSLNLSTFQSNLQKAPPILKAALDPRINEHTLAQIFASFEKRIDELSLQEKNAALSEVESQTGVSFYTLKENFGNSPTLKSLLSNISEAEPDSPMSSHQVHLATLLKFILDQKNEIPSPSNLTEQESALFGFASSIQGCSTGQKEGLAVAYTQLPDHIKPSFSNLAGKTETAAKAHQYLENFVQEELDSLFSTDNEFIHELTGTPDNEEISQLSHQS